MHGIVMWNSLTKEHSNLITWQGFVNFNSIKFKFFHIIISFKDGRCSKEFLKNLPSKSISDLNSGYGCATLFCHALNNNAEYLAKFNMAGTIHDYLTYLFCQVNEMSNQNALSWGYFDLNATKWQEMLCFFILNNFFLQQKIENIFFSK